MNIIKVGTSSVTSGDLPGPGAGHQRQCHRYTRVQGRAQGVDSS